MQVFTSLNVIVRAALTKDLRSAECPKIPCRFRGEMRMPSKPKGTADGATGTPPGRRRAGSGAGEGPAKASSTRGGRKASTRRTPERQTPTEQTREQQASEQQRMEDRGPVPPLVAPDRLARLQAEYLERLRQMMTDGEP